MSEVQKTTAPAPTPAHPANSDLEIKDARIIFEPIWDDLESHFGRQHLRFPKEIILLGGAPGAGKGTNTAFIAKTRGLTCAPIVMSSLLDTPEMKKIKDAGNMIGDREVLAASPTGTTIPASPTTSGTPPAAVTTTGRPAARASATTWPMPSVLLQ